MRRIFQIALLAALAVSSNALAAGARKSSGTRKSTRASKKPPEEATPPEASKPVEETRPSVEPKPLEPAVKPDAPVRPDAAVVPARPEGEKTPSAPVSTAWEWIGSHVRLRQSLEDKNQAAKPAAFQLTFPSDGKPVSLNVDAGLKMVGVLLPADTGSSQLEGSLGAEYHQKTDIAQPQNLLAVGAGLEWVLSPRLQESSNPDVLVANTVHDLQLNAQFKSDFGQNTQSVQAYLDYVPINFLYSGLIFPSRVKAGGSRWIAFSWLPTLGIEGEDVLPSAAGATGWLLRARGALDVSVYPAPDLFDQRLELNVVGELRYTVLSSSAGEYGGNLHPLFKASARYYVDEKERVSVGVDYLNGSNPRVNLAQQEFWQLGLRLQFPGRAE